MKMQDVPRLFAAVLAIVLIAFLAKNAAYGSEEDVLSATDSKSGSFDNDIMALAWHPHSVNKKAVNHKVKGAIPGLAPWAKALLDTAAKEQIQEVTRHAQSVKEQEALVAREKRAKALARERQEAIKKSRMQTEIRVLEKKVKTSLKSKAPLVQKAKAKAHLAAKKAVEVQKKLPVELRKINQKKESQYAAYSEVKTFFHNEEEQLQEKKIAAIKRVEEEAEAGITKIKTDLKRDVAKVIPAPNRVSYPLSRLASSSVGPLS
jgi:hypothetical protein